MSRLLPGLCILFCVACAPEDPARPGDPSALPSDTDAPPGLDTGDSDLPPGDDPVDLSCADEADCDFGNPCAGTPSCDDGVCGYAGGPVLCGEGELCTVDLADAVCATLCAIPTAPVLSVLAEGEVLRFTGAPGIQVATLPVGADLTDADWQDADELDVADAPGPLRVVARSGDPTCGPDEVFDHTYTVAPSYPGAAGTAGSSAVPKDDPRIVAWAAGHTEVVFGDGVDAAWRDPSRAYGPASGTSSDIVALGEGGWITVQFAAPFADGPGDDLAVFENSFSDTFLEFAYVEVSSDGVTFARFDSAAHTPDPAGSFGETNPEQVHGLAGDVRQGFGTAFDLSLLRFHPLVRAGQVDLGAIRFVRIVDVMGDGSMFDSFGRPIHDPYPTAGSGGFDLDAVAVLGSGS